MEAKRGKFPRSALSHAAKMEQDEAKVGADRVLPGVLIHFVYREVYFVN